MCLVGLLREESLHIVTYYKNEENYSLTSDFAWSWSLADAQTKVRDYLLFGGVVELILVGATETFLNADVGPQPLHGGQEFLGKWLRVLHPLDDVEHHFRVRLKAVKTTILGNCSSHQSN